MMLTFQICLRENAVGGSRPLLCREKQNYWLVKFVWWKWRRRRRGVVAGTRRRAQVFFWLIKQLKSFFVKAGQTMREAKPPRGSRSGFTAVGLMQLGVLFWARFQGVRVYSRAGLGAPGLVPTQWVAAAVLEDSNQYCKRTAGRNFPGKMKSSPIIRVHSGEQNVGLDKNCKKKKKIK